MAEKVFKVRVSSFMFRGQVVEAEYNKDEKFYFVDLEKAAKALKIDKDKEKIEKLKTYVLRKKA